jgi:retinol dehydrogenase-12
VVVKQLDLCSFDSVRAFAKDVLSSENRLDVLLNNAGCLVASQQLTKDG